MPQPITRNIQNDDLTARFQQTTHVAASPTDDAETIIGTLTLAGFPDSSVVAGVQLTGWAALTVGTNGDSVALAIRQTDGSGSVVASTGAVTATAADLAALAVVGFDALPGVDVYVLTVAVDSASAGSTVSALSLAAVVI